MLKVVRSASLWRTPVRWFERCLAPAHPRSHPSSGSTMPTAPHWYVRALGPPDHLQPNFAGGLRRLHRRSDRPSRRRVRCRPLHIDRRSHRHIGRQRSFGINHSRTFATHRQWLAHRPRRGSRSDCPIVDAPTYEAGPAVAPRGTRGPPFGSDELVALLILPVETRAFSYRCPLGVANRMNRNT